MTSRTSWPHGQSDSGRLVSEFHCRLDRAEQEAAIRQMAADGFSDHSIANVTGLHVEIVRHTLGLRNANGDLSARRA